VEATFDLFEDLPVFGAVDKLSGLSVFSSCFVDVEELLPGHSTTSNSELNPPNTVIFGISASYYA
jgi:hypothetical protein